MAHVVSRKLSNAFEGALAGGGDPATSPLYVFGPFLKLIVVGGVAQITFGVSVWLVVFTVAMVSAMYRLVMTWVTDGSGGSGLSEEEFGGWAVKVNAGITFVEYTLTFLVSMAALVTFLADRFPVLNHAFMGVQYRALVAIGLSVITGWVVNHGPKVSARAFGPATAGVLALLWVMIGATIVRTGFHLPDFNLAAFRPEYLFKFTLGGYARILAVMTGIEVFANLVAAYDGTPQARSRKAFGSLLIVMGTTAATMLIVGPAIFALSNPTDPHVSVFTQTMDRLLPSPLSYLGTLVGVGVLLSASAASAQGLQNLALGLKNRHYIPAVLGQRNRFKVADKPVWIEVGIVAVCFLLFGTHEETYLALYAAGVFILLSMTGWAAARRLIRRLGKELSVGGMATLAGTVIAATLTTGATAIILEERFLEGAWTYLLFLPVLYGVFSYFRQKLGAPSSLMEALGRREEAMLGVGFPAGRPRVAPLLARAPFVATRPGPPQPPAPHARWRGQQVAIERIMVSLDGSETAERVLPFAKTLCRKFGASLTLASVLPMRGAAQALVPLAEQRPAADRPVVEALQAGQASREGYLRGVAARIQRGGIDTHYLVAAGPIAQAINLLLGETRSDLLVMSTHGRSGVGRWLLGSVANAVIQLVTRPVLLVRPALRRNGRPPAIKRLLAPLDGSTVAEQVLPYALVFAEVCEGEIILLTVPEVPEPETYGPMGSAVEDLRREAEANAQSYLAGVVREVQEQGVRVRGLVTGSGPARTIVDVSEAENVDLIMIATHGRGGMDRLFLGNVADRVVHYTGRPVFLAPFRELRG